MRRLPLVLALAAVGAATGLTACGAGNADRDVVKRWADAVRTGRFEAADALFGLPAKVANGGPVMRFDTRVEIDFFNRSLPCGAILRRTRQAARGRLVATFELTEREGPGSACGSGTGHAAEVAFRVRDGRIVEWVRVATPPRGGGQLT